MNALFRNAAIALSAILLLNSCKKDKDEKSQAELLTQKAWIIVSDEERVGTTGTWTDYFPDSLPCEKDDQTIFKTNGTYELNEGATKCNPSNPQV